MKRVNFRSAKGIIDELEQAVEDVKADPDCIKEATTRIVGCKHAIQVFALSMMHQKMIGTVSPKLKSIEME